MPISFKRSVSATFHKKTAAADLLPCESCGGPNRMGKVAQSIDCTDCDKTGYSNFFTNLTIPVFYTPRAYIRYNSSEGGLTRFGDAQIKLDAGYIDVVDDARYVTVENADWDYQRMHIPGYSFGQERIILALTRR